MIAMTVTSNDHLSRQGIPLFDYDLVTNTTTSGIEIDAVLLCKCFNLLILPNVGLGLVLHIVIEGEYRLSRIVDVGARERQKL